MCYSPRVSRQPTTLNLSAWPHAAPARALSSLSWDRQRAPWPAPARPATGPVPRHTLGGADVPAGGAVARALPGPWEAGPRPGVARPAPPGPAGRQNKAPALPPVHAPLGPVLPPAQVEVEGCRAEARERRRGLPAARDARGRAGPRQAPPRWWWHAREPHTGQGGASGGGRRQADGVLPRPQRWAPLGLPRCAPDGWGAAARPRAAEPPQVGQEPPQHSASTPSNVRPRSPRCRRRTLGFAKTERRHDRVLGWCIHRAACGRPLCSGSNTCETSPDILFARFPYSIRMASVLYCVARKWSA